jgi:hypothetical protein
MCQLVEFRVSHSYHQQPMPLTHRALRGAYVVGVRFVDLIGKQNHE